MNFVGIEKLSLVDFDHHISCVLFTQGCNFKCPFCHNSDLVLGQNQQQILFDEILEYLIKRKGILDAVVITGGEPTLMPDLEDKIKTIKQLGYLIKLDTNGTNPVILKQLLENNLIDYVAMDVKNCFDKYNKTTNCTDNSLSAVKESISYLINHNFPYEFRTTIVKELHNEECIEKMGEELHGAKKIRLQLFKDNDNCIVHGLHQIEKDEAETYAKILKNHIQDVALRGYEQ